MKIKLLLPILIIIHSFSLFAENPKSKIIQLDDFSVETMRDAFDPNKKEEPKP